jgi:hypothetical protein
VDQAALIEEAPHTGALCRRGRLGWRELSKVDNEQLGAFIREVFRLMDAKAVHRAALNFPTCPCNEGGKAG